MEVRRGPPGGFPPCRCKNPLEDPRQTSETSGATTPERCHSLGVGMSRGRGFLCREVGSRSDFGVGRSGDAWSRVSRVGVDDAPATHQDLGGRERDALAAPGLLGGPRNPLVPSRVHGDDSVMWLRAGGSVQPLSGSRPGRHRGNQGTRGRFHSARLARSTAPCWLATSSPNHPNKRAGSYAT